MRATALLVTALLVIALILAATAASAGPRQGVGLAAVRLLD